MVPSFFPDDVFIAERLDEDAVDYLVTDKLGKFFTVRPRKKLRDKTVGDVPVSLVRCHAVIDCGIVRTAAHVFERIKIADGVNPADGRIFVIFSVPTGGKPFFKSLLFFHLFYPVPPSMPGKPRSLAPQTGAAAACAGAHPARAFSACLSGAPSP